MTEPSDKAKASNKAGARKAAAKKPAARKATTKKAAAKPAPARKAAQPKAALKRTPAKKTSPKKAQRPAPAFPSRITHEARWHMIAEAAYWRAEKRGFAGGGEVGDWLEAEADIDGQLAAAGIDVAD
jgi:hypothetical protein